MLNIIFPLNLLIEMAPKQFSQYHEGSQFSYLKMIMPQLFLFSIYYLEKMC
jgi:hypothetical protein